MLRSVPSEPGQAPWLRAAPATDPGARGLPLPTVSVPPSPSLSLTLYICLHVQFVQTSLERLLYTDGWQPDFESVLKCGVDIARGMAYTLLSTIHSIDQLCIGFLYCLTAGHLHSIILFTTDQLRVVNLQVPAHGI